MVCGQTRAHVALPRHYVALPRHYDGYNLGNRVYPFREITHQFVSEVTSDQGNGD